MKNNVLATSPQTSSPFDSIRHFDESGAEFWQARELMKLMGYTSWRSFKTPVEQAKENLEITGDSARHHFLTLTTSTGGRTREDYNLTRYACYMVALCCDGRKVEVASAKKYFVVKTREAEVVIPAQNEELEKLQLQVRLAETQRYLVDKRETLLTLHGEHTAAWICGSDVMEVKEVITESVVIDASSGRNVSFRGLSTAELARKLDAGSGKALEKWLSEIGRGDLTAQGMRAIQAPYIPEENIAEVKRLWNQYRSECDRQMLLGE